MCAALKVDHHANIFCRFIAKRLNTFEFFLTHEVRDLNNEIGFVDTIWNFGNNDLECA